MRGGAGVSGHTQGPWEVTSANWDGCEEGEVNYCIRMDGAPASKSNARVIEAGPDMLKEMARFLPVLERAEADADIWTRLTAGEGIATANAYRAAIAKATGGQP